MEIENFKVVDVVEGEAGITFVLQNDDLIFVVSNVRDSEEHPGMMEYDVGAGRIDENGKRVWFEDSDLAESVFEALDAFIKSVSEGQ